MPDMHELLEIARSDAPPPRLRVDDIVAAGRRRRRWMLTRRFGGAGVAAVAVVTGLVLVAGNVALSGAGTAPPGGPPARPAFAPPPPVEVPPFTFTFTAFRVGDYRVLPPVEVATTHQVASVLVDYRTTGGRRASAYVGRLTVYRPGLAPPASYLTGTKLTVRGRDAYLSQHRHSAVESVWGDTYVMTGEPIVSSALTWQYAANAWAVIGGPADDPEHILTPDVVRQIADRFTLGSAVRARIPFRAGYLPTGARLASVSGQNFTSEDIGMVTVVYTLPDPAPRASAGERGSDGVAPLVVISIGQQDTPPPDAPRRKDRCSSERRWCTWPIAGTRFYLAVRDPSKTLTVDELLRVGRELDFADLEQPQTWFPI
jgi:hypothetical protein